MEQRERECFALTDEDADAARAFGCLLDLPPGRTRPPVRHRPRVARRPARQKIAAPRAPRRSGSSAREARTPSAPQDDPEKEARREQRQRDYEARVAGRARNLDLGAALTRWQPKLDTDAVKLLGSLVLLHYGKAAWAHRLCVEQPTTTNKQGKVSVRYPRGAQAEAELHGERPSA